jgi:transposase
MIELLPKERVRLALIAVCNKLLKQAFAIATSGLIYDKNYKSILVKN